MPNTPEELVALGYQARRDGHLQQAKENFTESVGLCRGGEGARRSISYSDALIPLLVETRAPPPVRGGHGVFDFVHHFLIENPGMPRWWPGFCATFDVIFGGLLAVRLWMRRVETR